jgi:hypothetical protein
MQWHTIRWIFWINHRRGPPSSRRHHVSNLIRLGIFREAVGSDSSKSWYVIRAV